MNTLNKSDILSQIKAAQATDEATLRQELASLYHVMDFNGWGDLIVTHCSVRIPNTDNHFLIAPFGLMFCEVTAENLVCIDGNGCTIGSSDWEVNDDGINSHLAIYQTRADINAIIHTHTTTGIAIASVDQNLEILDHMSLMLHEKLGYYDYDGPFGSESDPEKKKLKEVLQGHDLLILRNHGLITLGTTIAEAFWHYYYLEHACDVALKVLSTHRPFNNLSEELKSSVQRKFKEWNTRQDSAKPNLADLAFAAAKRKLIYTKYYDP